MRTLPPPQSRRSETPNALCSLFERRGVFNEPESSFLDLLPTSPPSAFSLESTGTEKTGDRDERARFLRSLARPFVCAATESRSLVSLDRSDPHSMDLMCLTSIECDRSTTKRFVTTTSWGITNVFDRSRALSFARFLARSRARSRASSRDRSLASSVFALRAASSSGKLVLDETTDLDEIAAVAATAASETDPLPPLPF
nr:MAG: hypothetical protein [Apis mellifera filamentous virus]